MGCEIRYSGNILGFKINIFVHNKRNDQKTATMKRMQSYVTLHSATNRACTKHIRAHYKQIVTKKKRNVEKKKNEMWFDKVVFRGVRENI
jgi:hypothetical protein